MKVEENGIITTEEKKKGNKTQMVIVALILLTILAVIGITYAILEIKGRRLSVTIDGQKVKFSEDTFIFAENRKSVYINKRYSSTCWI